MSSAVEREEPTASIRASLVVRGFDGDPHLVSEVIGVAATRVGRAGEPIRGPTGQATNRSVKQTYWALQSRSTPESVLADHVADLIAMVGDVRSLDSRLPPGAELMILCTVIPDRGLPLLEVPPKLLTSIGALGASLRIDVIEVDDA